jgi:dynein heavy chain
LFFGNLSFVFFLQSYYDVRAEIEQSGRDSRWEFDNKRLFKLTDHMAIICNDFIAIAKELEQFYNIFTPELKSVTGKPHKINEILERVHKVLELIEHVKTFSIIKLFLSNIYFSSGTL